MAWCLDLLRIVLHWNKRQDFKVPQVASEGLVQTHMVHRRYDEILLIWHLVMQFSRNSKNLFLLADGKPYVLFTTFWTCTHVRCYATSGLGVGVGVGCNNIFKLEHMSMLRNIWACTHVRCYATSGLAHMVVATQHHGLRWGGGWGGVGMMMFFGLAHMLDATELLMFFRFAHMLDATQPRKRKAPVWLRWLHYCAWTYDCCLRRYIIY